MSYVNEWQAAVERTMRFELAVPPHQIDTARRWFDNKALNEFPFIIRDSLGDLGFEDVVAQCLSIHYRLVPVIEEWLGCPALFTLGWVDTGTESGMFRFDEVFIAEKLKSGHSGGSVNMHAWLTLPSMEIIDVSLATSIGVFQKRPEMYGMAITKYADELRGMAYKPMLVGEDFLRKTGLLLEWASMEIF